MRNTPSPNIKAAADQSRAAIKIQDRQVQQKEEKEASSTLVESPVPIFHGDLGARLPPLCPPHAAAWRNHPGLRGGEAGGGSGKEVARIRQMRRRRRGLGRGHGGAAVGAGARRPRAAAGRTPLSRRQNRG